jgi:hypothetical protein
MRAQHKAQRRARFLSAARMLLLALVCLCLAAPVAGASEPEQTAAAKDAQAVLAESAVADQVLDPVSGSLVETSSGDLALKGVGVNATVAADPAEGLRFAGIDITPVGVSAAATDAQAVAGDAIVYANTAKDADTFFRPATGGLELFTLINGPDAPQEYSWRIDLEPGFELDLADDGSAWAVNPVSGEIALTIPAPWAKDANGELIDGVHFVISGNTLTLVVPFDGETALPVLADPQLETTSSTVGASTSALGSRVPVPYYTYKVSNVHSIGTTYRFHGWPCRGWGPNTIGWALGATFSHGNSFSVGCGIPSTTVSAAVGFDVAWSHSFTVTGSHHVAKGKYGWAGYSDVFSTKSYTVHRTFHCGDKTKDGGTFIGTARNAVSSEFTGVDTAGPNRVPPDPHSRD